MPPVPVGERTFSEDQLSEAIRWLEQKQAEDSIVTPWAIFTFLDGRASPVLEEPEGEVLVDRDALEPVVAGLEGALSRFGFAPSGDTNLARLRAALDESPAPVPVEEPAWEIALDTVVRRKDDPDAIYRVTRGPDDASGVDVPRWRLTSKHTGGHLWVSVPGLQTLWEPVEEREAECDRCGAPKGRQAIGEGCNTNCGGRVVPVEEPEREAECWRCGGSGRIEVATLDGQHREEQDCLCRRLSGVPSPSPALEAEADPEPSPAPESYDKLEGSAGSPQTQHNSAPEIKVGQYWAKAGDIGADVWRVVGAFSGVEGERVRLRNVVDSWLSLSGEMLRRDYRLVSDPDPPPAPSLDYPEQLTVRFCVVDGLISGIDDEGADCPDCGSETVAVKYRLVNPVEDGEC